MSIGMLVWAMGLRGVSSNAKLVAICVSDCPDGSDGDLRAAVTMKWCQNWTALTEPQIMAAIRELGERGFAIEVIKGKIHLSFFVHEDEQAQHIGKGRCFVYVIAGGGLTKIGISANPKSRLSALQNSNPHARLSLIFTKDDDHVSAAAAETSAHIALIGYHVGNEWFEVSPERAVEEVELAFARLAGAN